MIAGIGSALAYPVAPMGGGLGADLQPQPKPQEAQIQEVTSSGVSGDAGGLSLGLSEEERAVVDQLKARDREVRDHEEAHARVGGPYAGAPSYTYQTGPDGQQYAVGGEVPIDVSEIPGDPAATIDKMDVVKAAALAPAEPSSADRNVAAEADAKRLAAVADLRALRSAERADPEVDLRL